MNLSLWLDAIVTFIGDYPTLALFVVFAAAMGEALFVIGLFVPSTVVLVGAGTLIGTGHLSFWPVFVATTLGAIAGDAASYWFGSTYGANIRKVWPFSRYRIIIDQGEKFFARHGGKSVFIGRFIPGVKSVVPGIAGMMGMGAFHFTVVNVVSAFVWAAAHILPGVAIGRGLNTTRFADPRTLEVLIALAILLILAWYAAKFAIRYTLPVLETMRASAMAKLEKRPSRAARFAWHLLAAERDLVLPYALGGISLLALGGFLVLLLNLLIEPQLAAADASISGLVQSLRSEPIDTLMIQVTMAGDGIVLGALAVALIGMLLVARRYRLAGGFLVTILSAAAFVPISKSLVSRSRPIELYSGPDAYSFPSGHATNAMVIWGTLALLLAHGLPWQWRRAIYLGTAMLIFSIGLSRIYLGAHWPSDVVAGMSFGGAMVVIFAFLLHHWRRSLPNRKMAIAVALAFAIVYPTHVATGFDDARQAYRVRTAVAAITTGEWLGGGWRQLPAWRSELDGETGEQFLLQTDFSRDQLDERLAAAGWTAVHDDLWLNGLFAAALPSDSPIAQRSVLPQTNHGLLPVAVFHRSDGPDHRIVARFWETELTASGRPILVMTLHAERLAPLIAGWSILDADTPTLASARTAMSDIASALDARVVESDGRRIALAVQPQ